MPHAWLTWTDGRTVGRYRHGRQAESVDQLRAGIEGSGGGEQAKIVMSHQGRGLRRRTYGQAGGYKQSCCRVA